MPVLGRHVGSLALLRSTPCALSSWPGLASGIDPRANISGKSVLFVFELRERSSRRWSASRSHHHGGQGRRKAGGGERSRTPPSRWRRREGPRPRTPSKPRDALEHDTVLKPLSVPVPVPVPVPAELTLFLYVYLAILVCSCVCVVADDDERGGPEARRERPLQTGFVPEGGSDLHFCN